MNGSAAIPKSEDSTHREFSVRSAMSIWMQELAPHGIFTTDEYLRITSWNDWLVVHSGLRAEEVLGRNLHEVFPDLVGRHLGSRYVRALAGEISVLSTALHRYLLPFPVTVANTALPHMLQTARVAPLREMSEVIGTITVIEDVTERELHSNFLRRQQEVDRLLSSSLAVFLQSDAPAEEIAGIFATISPVLGLDSYVSYLLASDGQNLHLVAIGGILPKLRESLVLLPLSDLDRQNLRGTLAPTELNVSSHLAALQLIGLRSCWSFPLRVADRVVGLVVFGSYDSRTLPTGDISVLDRIARYFAIALDRAMRERDTINASRAKDDFLAALSHELRTPLNPVLLVASDGAANPDFSPEAREAFQVIEKNAQLEARLIDDLLDLTRIEHSKLSLELQVIDVHAAIADALETVRPDIAAQVLTLHIDLAAKDHLVTGDAARLQQVFWNILKNAVKFTPKGGSIFVRTQSDGIAGEIAVTVRDTGIGMEPSEVGRIFEAFSQGDHAISGRSHRFGGLGLGLAISRKLVMMHGGRISASSEGKDRGSTFALYLPLGSPATTPLLTSPSTHRTGSLSPLPAPTPGARLLLVEDHEATRVTLVHLLQRRGYVVVGVESALKAQEQAASQPFDLVLSDIGLPDTDGFELMRLLRDRHSLKGIALTGYGMEEDLVKSSDAGFIAHLTKPINVKMLDRTLAKVLALSQSV